MSLREWLSDVPGIGEILDIRDLFNCGMDDSGPPPEDIEYPDPHPEGGTADIEGCPPTDYPGLRKIMFWTEVGDTGLDTRNFLLAENSLVPVQWDETGTQVIAGKWEDITGYISSNPEDFDVDHRVSFSQIAREYPGIYDLSHDEQLAIYNDQANLQILQDTENVRKSNMPPEQYADKITDPGKRARFLEDGSEYLKTLHDKFKV